MAGEVLGEVWAVAGGAGPVDVRVFVRGITNFSYQLGNTSKQILTEGVPMASFIIQNLGTIPIELGNDRKLRYGEGLRIPANSILSGGTITPGGPSLLLLEQFAKANIPAAGNAGRVIELTDYARDVWLDDGTRFRSIGHQVFDVIAFGADLTGVADSAAAVNAAIAALPAAGGTIVFPPGTYLLTSPIVVNKHGVQLIGAGVGATLLVFTLAGWAAPASAEAARAAIEFANVAGINPTGIVVEGFNINARGNTGQAGMKIACSFSSFRDISIEYGGALSSGYIMLTDATGTGPYFDVVENVHTGGLESIAGTDEVAVRFSKSGAASGPNANQIIGGNHTSSVEGFRINSGAGNFFYGCVTQSIRTTHWHFTGAGADVDNTVYGAYLEGDAAALPQAFLVDAGVVGASIERAFITGCAVGPLVDNGTRTTMVLEAEWLTRLVFGGALTLQAATSLVEFATNNAGKRAIGSINYPAGDDSIDVDVLGGTGSAGRLRLNPSGNPVILGTAGGKLGFYGAAEVVKQDVAGSRGGNAALANLLTALATEGVITDSTTA